MAKNKGAEGTENTENQTAAADPVSATEKAPAKSIVPSKYAGKYKSGQRDALGTFIDGQCVGKEGFEYSAFFELCRKNGIAEDQVKKYEDIVASKVGGGAGRARMTLRNMLATVARKDKKLTKLDGSTEDIDVPPAITPGSRKKAEEQAAAA